MTCSTCGTYVAPGVRFCSNCGAPAVDSEPTRIARIQGGLPQSTDLDNDIEKVIFTVRPTMVFIKIGYALAVLAAFAIVFLLAWINIPAYIAVLIGLVFLLVPAYYHLRRNMVRYTLTDSKIEIDTGLIARTTRNIPLSKIQDVTVSASIPQRILGFGDVIIDNASELGGTTLLHNISDPRRYADLLLRQLRRWH